MVDIEKIHKQILWKKNQKSLRIILDELESLKIIQFKDDAINFHTIKYLLYFFHAAHELGAIEPIFDGNTWNYESVENAPFISRGQKPSNLSKNRGNYFYKGIPTNMPQYNRVYKIIEKAIR